MFSSSENFHTYETFPFSDLHQDLILFFITTRTFVKFIFHSKFIEPSINTHIVKHCDGINMFSSSEFHIYETFPFSDLYQDFLVRRYQFYFYRDSKHKVERTQYFHFIDFF